MSSTFNLLEPRPRSNSDGPSRSKSPSPWRKPDEMLPNISNTEHSIEKPEAEVFDNKKLTESIKDIIETLQKMKSIDEARYTEFKRFQVWYNCFRLQGLSHQDALNAARSLASTAPPAYSA